jgi:hypothetical protein
VPSIRVDSGQSSNERRLAVVDMAGCRKDSHDVTNECCWIRERPTRLRSRADRLLGRRFAGRAELCHRVCGR